MLKIIKSFITLVIVSTILSLPFTHTVAAFSVYFAMWSLIQIVGWNIYTKYVSYKFNQLAIKMEAELAKQGISTTCPCSRNIKMFIPIELNKDNSFKCLECSKNVAVAVNVKTFLSTEPVDLETSDIALNALYNKVVKAKAAGGNENGI